MSKIIDGKEISQQIKDECKDYLKKLKAQGKEVCLAVILVGDNSASKVYVANKKRACEYVGIKSLSYELEESISQQELLDIIYALNKRDDVDGILVQLPLPKHIDEDAVIDAISPKKDVDGFHPINTGNLSIGRKGFVSCTPAGIIEILKRSDILIEGKNAVVIGRSNIVGKPMAQLLLRENATVTITHSKTKNLPEICKNADILIAAIGRARFIGADFIKKDAVVIDVGMNRDEEGKLCGDVDFEAVKDITSAITPVPGGVGPMTIAMLMYNCAHAAEIAE